MATAPQKNAKEDMFLKGIHSFSYDPQSHRISILKQAKGTKQYFSIKIRLEKS
jgi:hypothetical protein